MASVPSVSINILVKDWACGHLTLWTLLTKALLGAQDQEKLQSKGYRAIAKRKADEEAEVE